MLVRQMTNDELCAFANTVKDLIAETMKIDELNKYAVVIVEKGIFGRAWDALFGSVESKAIIRLMMDVPRGDKELPSA